MVDTIIDIVYTYDSNPEDFTNKKHPRNVNGHFQVTSVTTKKHYAEQRGDPTPKGKALKAFRSKFRKPSKHENPSGPGRTRSLNPG